MFAEPISRRRLLAAGAAGLLTARYGLGQPASRPGSRCADDGARAAALAWFRQKRFGLFMHYGLYSLLGRGEWVMHRENIPVPEYTALQKRFTAERFDAEAIADLAVAAGMSYINITSRHHDGFCLFRTATTQFTSLHAPAKRDLVGELAEACRKRKLALFLYYSYALDWTHPYFFPRTENCAPARPKYDQPEPSYRFASDADFARYIDYVHTQIGELLTQYRPAGLWFDPLMGYYCRPELFPVDQSYALIRRTLPGCLISFKQGANGDEDFVAPERQAQGLKRGGEHGKTVWQKNQGKPVEICNTLQPGEWGYQQSVDSKHRTPDEVVKLLEEARTQGANLLLNTGPLGDGSIHPEDVATLREVGKRLPADHRDWPPRNAG